MSTGRFYDFRVKMDRVQEDGMVREVVEEYVVRAESVVEANEGLMKEMIGEDVVEIVSVRKMGVKEVFDGGEVDADKWYKVRWAAIMMDEKTQAERLMVSNVLVKAEGFFKAWEAFEKEMRRSVMDYKVLSIAESKIVEVFC